MFIYHNLKNLLFNNTKTIFLIFLSLFLLTACQNTKQKENKTINKKLKTNEVTYDTSNLIIDNYAIGCMTIHDKKLIVGYYPNTEQAESAIVRVYNKDTFQLKKEIKTEYINNNTKLISYDNFFYFDNGSSSNIKCYNYDLNVVKEISITTSNVSYIAINPSLTKISYIRKDSNNYAISYLCENSINLNSEEIILTINQTKPNEIFSIDKVYYSNNNYILGFMGQSFQSLEYNSEAKTIYGTIDLSTKKIDFINRENIDVTSNNGIMLIYYKDGYQSDNSKKDNTILIDLNTQNKISIATNMLNDNLEFSMCSSNSFFEVGYDKNSDSSSYILKFFVGNNVHTINNDDLNIPNNSARFVGTFDKENNRLLIYYQAYNESEEKIYQYIKDITINDENNN